MSVGAKKWRLEVTLTNTNILHVRKSQVHQTKFTFFFDKIPVPYCSSYKYLGVTINHTLDYKYSVQILAESVSKALSLIITKMIKAGSLP